MDYVRVTRVEPTDGSEPYEFKDDWTDEDHAHRKLDTQWTGVTMFRSLYVKDEGTYGDEKAGSSCTDGITAYIASTGTLDIHGKQAQL